DRFCPPRPPFVRPAGLDSALALPSHQAECTQSVPHAIEPADRHSTDADHRHLFAEKWNRALSLCRSALAVEAATKFHLHRAIDSGCELNQASRIQHWKQADNDYLI